MFKRFRHVEVSEYEGGSVRGLSGGFSHTDHRRRQDREGFGWQPHHHLKVILFAKLDNISFVSDGARQILPHSRSWASQRLTKWTLARSSRWIEAYEWNFTNTKPAVIENCKEIKISMRNNIWQKSWSGAWDAASAGVREGVGNKERRHSCHCQVGFPRYLDCVDKLVFNFNFKHSIHSQVGF